MTSALLPKLYSMQSVSHDCLASGCKKPLANKLCMQGPSWSSVDAGGHWRLLHYRMRHVFAPLLVSGTFDAGTRQLDIHVTNDHPHALQGAHCLT